MKPATPPSYTSIFGPISQSSSAVNPHRALLLITGASSGSLVVTLQDGTTPTIGTIPANTVFILPLTVKCITTLTNVTAYGLL